MSELQRYDVGKPSSISKCDDGEWVSAFQSEMLILSLQARIAELEGDAARFRWLSGADGDEPIVDGFNHCELDYHEHLSMVVHEAGELHPTPDHHVEAFRRLIDAASKGEQDE